MDFHSLSRRELQSLCKLNKIPANTTNVAMADALQYLEIVNGIEEVMNVSNPETADSVESMEKVEVFSPKAPTPRCRTSTRQKVKIIEPETLPPKTVARSTRWGNKQSNGEVEESKNEILKTPAISTTTRRKAPANVSCRNVNKQLNECEKEAKEEGKLPMPYSTRRSSRLTEKKSTEPKVKKESANALKMGSFVDEVHIVSEEVNVTPEYTMTSGNPAAEVEEICNAFEKLDVVIVNEEANQKSGEGKQDFGELNQELTNTTSNPCEDEMVVEEGDVNSVLEEVVVEAQEDFGEIAVLKKESTNETSNPCEDGDFEENLKMGEEDGEEDDAKPESDAISSPFQNVEQKLDIQEAVSGNISIVVNDQSLVQEENSDSNDISSPYQEENLEQKINLEDKTVDASEAENISAILNEEHSDFLLDNHSSFESGAEGSIGSPELTHKDETIERKFGLEDKKFYGSEVNNLSPVEEQIQVLESNGMAIDNTDNSSVMEEVSENSVDVIPTADLKSELFTENSGEITNVPEEKEEFHVLSAAPCVFKNATPLKNMSIVSDDKENIDSGRKLPIGGIVDEGKNSKNEEKTEIEKLKNFNDISMRQLKKQLKLLTLKNVDTKKEGATTRRPALQALCENQLVGGESKN